MAVSGSVDYTTTAEQLIKDARAELGVNADEEPLDATELERGKRLLNEMLKAWEADGVYAWVSTEGTLTLVASDEQYTFQAAGDFATVPMDILQMRITRNSQDLEMTRMTREEYFALPNKTSTGQPTQWYYDRQRDTGTLYVWPAPDSTAGTLKFTYRRRLMDIDTGADNFDVPQEWYRALRLCLADEMIGPYGKAGTEEGRRVERKAVGAYLTVKSYDTAEQETSIYMRPSPYARR